MRKAQVSIFVIVGILIVAGVGFFVISQQEVQQTQLESLPVISQSLESADEIQAYIESCMESELRPLLHEMAIRGGTLEPSVSRMYEGVEYSYLCLQEPASGCVNVMRSREQMQEQLSEALASRLPFCIDLETFEASGYSIEQGEMDPKVIIAPKTTTVILNFPLQIQRNEVSFKEDSFEVIVPTHFGRMYELAMHIVNEEVGGFFDKEVWMRRHQADIEIHKSKPYPDLIYSLRNQDKGEKIEFNFAIQGRDTASEVDAPKTKPDPLGYCQTEDSVCFFNIDRDRCTNSYGSFSSTPPSNCEGLASFDEGCVNCRDCGSRAHGESWCEYDSVTGNGFDFVGSRHYLRSCHDGVIYFEECRDYREEICVEGTSASCRVNRWQDCVLQQERSSCEDTSLRDCVWDESLNPASKRTYIGVFDDRRCHPQVPPGFKHWQLSGLRVCQMANEYNDCDGISCPQDWVESTARYCYHMGDCGNYRNILGDFSDAGFFTTQNPPNDYIYPDESYAKVGQEVVLSLQGSSDQEPLYEDMYSNPLANINVMLTQLAAFARHAAGWDKDDFAKQLFFKGSIKYSTRHASFCSVWQPNSESHCELCDVSVTPLDFEELQHANKPCTEYKCHSLGSNCVYEEQDGYGVCTQAQEDDGTIPFITDFESDLDVTDTAFFTYSGWKVTEPQYPYTVVSFNVSTSEQTQCKLSLFPGLRYSQIPYQVGAYADEHEFIYRIPNTVELAEYFQDISDTLTLFSLAQVEELERLIADIKRDARRTAREFGANIGPFISRIEEVERNYRNNVKPELVEFIALTQHALDELLAELQAQRHVVFVKCIDRSQNEGEEAIVLFDLREDDQAPQPVDSQIVNGEIIFTLNEPSECRYSTDAVPFAQMRQSIDCDSVYDDSHFVYECRFSPATSEEIFVMCRDNPRELKQLYLSTAQGDSAKSDHDFSSFIKLEEGVISVSSDFALSENNTQVNLSASSAKLEVNFTQSVRCRIDEQIHSDFTLYPDVALDCLGKECSIDLEIKDTTYYIGCEALSASTQNLMQNPLTFQLP